jgi:YVTN family beta-propeller protein
MNATRLAFCLAATLAVHGPEAAGAGAAANFPPVVRGSVTPLEAWVGQSVAFSSAGTFDPDSGPSPLSYLWDFRDGTTSTAANPSHSYKVRGAYAVQLTVSDGADSVVTGFLVTVLAPPTSGAPAKSSPLALAPGDRELWVVNPDSSTVSVLDVAALPPIVRAEIPVGRKPRSVAVSANGAEVYVACQEAGALWVLDRAARSVLRQIPVGHQPYGVAIAPISGDVLVTNQGGNSLDVFASTLTRKARLALAAGPRAIAINSAGSAAYVSHYLTRGSAGTVTEIDLTAPDVGRSAALQEDPGPDTASSGRGFPNLLSAMAVDPAGLSVWVGGLKSNTGRGPFVSGEALVPTNRVRGMVGELRLASVSEIWAHRIDTDDADMVSAIGFSPNGRYAYVVHQGAGTLSVYDLPKAALFTGNTDGSTAPFASRIDVGDAPQGIVISAAGTRGFVTNFLSRSVQVLDLSNPASPSILATVQVTPEALSAPVALGKKLFYRSRAPLHSAENYVACASCHADGAMNDGRTWDLTGEGEGLRNTIDLRGRGGMDHGPVHWSGNFDEIQDFENAIVHSFGGSGLAQDGNPPNPPLGKPNAGRSADLDALAAYVSSLKTAPASPFRNADGTLTAAALRGKAIFEDPAVGCTRCHAGPRFTDSVLTPDPANYIFHDVGTLGAGSGARLGVPLTGLDTPTLFGLWDTAPYLHDGSAATLLDVLTIRNHGDGHGVTSQLSAAQLADLTEYLLSIDGTNDSPLPGLSSGGGGGGGCGLLGIDALLLSALLLNIQTRWRNRP